MLKIPYLSFTKREVHLEGGRESSHDLLREGIKAYYLILSFQTNKKPSTRNLNFTKNNMKFRRNLY